MRRRHHRARGIALLICGLLLSAGGCAKLWMDPQEYERRTREADEAARNNPNSTNYGGYGNATSDLILRNGHTD